MSEYQIFLSYGSPDVARAKALYSRLRARGLNVWFDKEQLRPGHRWDFEIKRALRQSEIVLFLISNTSIERRGYVQREMKLALSYLEEKLPGDIYVIPILLDRGIKLEAPLSDIQYITADEADFEDTLVGAIEAQLTSLGHESAQTDEHQQVSMSKQHERETWEGLPGYDMEYWLPRFDSDIYPDLSEITTIVESEFLEERHKYRRLKLLQDTNLFHWSDPSFRRTNTFSANILEYQVVGRLLSIVFILDFYGAGAAHENYSFKTFNFFLSPLYRIPSIKEIFSDANAALPVVRDLVRSSLKNSLLKNDDGSESSDPTFIDWIKNGTESWDNLRHFSFVDGSLSVHFPPYEVACFADGPQRAEVPLDAIQHLLSRDVAGFLGLAHWL